jgi:WD40 repeat protein
MILFSIRPAASPWGEKLPFNTVCGEFSSGTGGWVHSVAFSPNGDSLAFTGHDATITVVSPGSGSIQSIRAPYLPYLSILWLSENQIVAAGHDCAPHLFEIKGQQWYGKARCSLSMFSLCVLYSLTCFDYDIIGHLPLRSILRSKKQMSESLPETPSVAWTAVLSPRPRMILRF